MTQKLGTTVVNDDLSLVLYASEQVWFKVVEMVVLLCLGYFTRVLDAYVASTYTVHVGLQTWKLLGRLGLYESGRDKRNSPVLQL